MAAILASHGCYRCHVDLNYKGREAEDLSFSKSIFNWTLPKIERDAYQAAERCLKFQVDAAQTEANRLGTNGRPSKMVSTKELIKNRTASRTKEGFVNGAKMNVNGVSLVKNNTTEAIVKARKAADSKEFPFTDEVKVLPSDKGFSWANNNYNTWQRSIDVWSFVLSLRLRIVFDNAKWAYIGGFTEDKQVSYGNPIS